MPDGGKKLRALTTMRRTGMSEKTSERKKREARALLEQRAQQKSQRHQTTHKSTKIACVHKSRSKEEIYYHPAKSMFVIS